MKTIAVDFDGVIHAYSKGWQDGTVYDEPLPGAFDALGALMQHHAVFIHTSRDPEQVAQWLTVKAPAASNLTVTWETPGVHIREFWNERGALLVTNRKLPAAAYIDDRGIRFSDWGQTLDELRAHGLLEQP